MKLASFTLLSDVAALSSKIAQWLISLQLQSLSFPHSHKAGMLFWQDQFPVKSTGELNGICIKICPFPTIEDEQADPHLHCS